MRKVSGLTAVLVAGWATVAWAADTYPVRLSVPSRVGDTGAVSFKATRSYSQTWTAGGNGRPPVAYTIDATLDGTETVDAISSEARPVKVTIAVASCTKGKVQLLPAGATVTAETVGGRTTFKVNGRVPIANVALVLDQMIYTARPDEPTADEEFGTDRPRKVGETWPANVDLLAKATKLPYPVTGQDFTGDATLTGVSTNAGQLTGTVRLTEHCAFDSRPEANGTIVKDLRMDRQFTMSIPMGTDAHVGGSKQMFKVAFTVTGPAGTQAVRAEDRVERTYGDVRK